MPKISRKIHELNIRLETLKKMTCSKLESSEGRALSPSLLNAPSKANCNIPKCL